MPRRTDHVVLAGAYRFPVPLGVTTGCLGKSFEEELRSARPESRSMLELLKSGSGRRMPNQPYA